MTNLIRLICKNLRCKNPNLFSILSKCENNNLFILPRRNVSITKCLFEEKSVKMPALSPTMTAGTIVKWHKNEGDKIAAGDILCEVQTDKAVVAYEFDDDAVLAKIIVDENSSEIQVGELIAIVCDEDDDWKNVKVPDKHPDASAKTSADAKAVEASESDRPIDLGKLKISPSARNLIDQYGIDTATVQPTGNRGVMMKEDVLNFIQKNGLQPKDLSSMTTSTTTTLTAEKPSKAPKSAESPFTDIELSNMRRTIAKRLTESKSTIPHAYMRIKCSTDALLELRKYFKQKSVPVSLNDMIVKAAALALRQTPAMNCQWDAQTETIKLISDIDVSIAVATPTGLITPIIRNANRLTLEEIGETSKQLINKAKDGKLQPHEFVGGTFSISNLGMFDIDHFVGVINPPQAAILAVGASRRRFICSENDDTNFNVFNQTIMSLSYDTRAIDEELAACFLENLRNNLADKQLLLTSDGSTTNRRLSSFI